MNSENPTEKLIQSLKDLLEWYKYAASPNEMDFGMIHTICRLIECLDADTRSKLAWEELKDTIILNPGGEQGRFVFFLDPQDL